MTTKVRYLSVDPGESNGLCGYDIDGRLLWMATTKLRDLARFIEELRNVHTCIIEDYKIHPHKAQDHIYKDVVAIRAIGKIENWIERYNIKEFKQPNKHKTTGYQYMGKKPPPKSDPRRHELDAHAHFLYWGVNSKLINPADLI